MSLLTRYLVKEFLRLFCLCLTGGVALYLIIDLFDRIDRYLQYGGTIQWILLFFLYKIPLMIYQIIPAAMLLGVLLTLGILAKHNEIIALRTSGIPVWRIAYPFIAISVFVSFGSFLLNEFIVPISFQRSEYIQNVHIKGQTPAGLIVRDRIWFRGEEWIYNIASFLPSKNELQGIVLLKVTGPFQLTRRIDAEKAIWKDPQWVLYDVVERSFQAESIKKTSYSAQKQMDLSESPEDFQVIQKGAEEMPFLKLQRFIKKIGAEGYDPTPYIVALHKKIAFPVLNIITVFLGVPFALRFSRYGGFVVGIGISLVLGFLYWVFFAITISIGQMGFLPPFISAWGANLLFAALGVYLLLRVEEQTIN